MNTNLITWLDEWRDALDDGAGRRGQSTIDVYLRSVRQFLAWLDETHPEVTSEDEITGKHCQSWMKSLRDNGMAESTRRIRGISLKKWLRYVTSESELLTSNPAEELELPVPKPPRVEIVPDGDLKKLLDSMSGKDFLDRRDTAIVRLLFDCGIRRAELCNINLSDIDLNSGLVLVHGKGNKDRLVQISGSKTTLALRRYLRARTSHMAAHDAALFVTQHTKSDGEHRITGDGVWRMLLRRADRAGLGPIHPHQFRHTYAATAKGAGMSSEDLDRNCGWTTGEMSKRYGAVVADAQARETQKRLRLGDRV